MQRQCKRTVRIGNVTIGGNEPIAVQTMLNVPVKDIAGNVEQARRVAKAGCQIVRVTVPTPADAAVVAAIKEAVDIPVVADIHFDYKAALAALDAGADKIRINPGNIGADDRVKAVADACNAKGVPIRIGVNGGSLEKHILAKYGAPVPEAMVESAMYHVRLLEKHDFDNIVISIKSSNVPRMMAAYRMLSAQTDYPLHVGVTEAGGNRMGLIKSGMGIGGLLLEGIGDTLRVSLTDEPENEVYAGYDILRAVGYAVAGARDHQLPDLRPYPVPDDGDCQTGRGPPARRRLQKAAQDRHYGLHRQRPGRSVRRRYRHCGRQRRSAALHPRPACADAQGEHCRPIHRRDL